MVEIIHKVINGFDYLYILDGDKEDLWICNDTQHEDYLNFRSELVLILLKSELTTNQTYLNALSKLDYFEHEFGLSKNIMLAIKARYELISSIGGQHYFQAPLLLDSKDQVKQYITNFWVTDVIEEKHEGKTKYLVYIPTSILLNY